MSKKCDFRGKNIKKLKVQNHLSLFFKANELPRTRNLFLPSRSRIALPQARQRRAFPGIITENWTDPLIVSFSFFFFFQRLIYVTTIYLVVWAFLGNYKLKTFISILFWSVLIIPRFWKVPNPTYIYSEIMGQYGCSTYVWYNSSSHTMLQCIHVTNSLYFLDFERLRTNRKKAQNEPFISYIMKMWKSQFSTYCIKFWQFPRINTKYLV